MGRTWYPHRWEPFGHAMRQKWSCRKTAAVLGVNVKTASAWRHKVLRSLRVLPSSQLGGMGEMDETYFPRSAKGQRYPGRPAHRRGAQILTHGLTEDPSAHDGGPRPYGTHGRRSRPHELREPAAPIGALNTQDSELCSDEAAYLAGARPQPQPTPPHPQPKPQPAQTRCIPSGGCYSLPPELSGLASLCRRGQPLEAMSGCWGAGTQGRSPAATLSPVPPLRLRPSRKGGSLTINTCWE